LEATHVSIRRKELARMIDSTLLNPLSTRDQVERLCDEAKSYGVYAVCINSAWIPFAVKALLGTEVKVSSTVGFPLGASLSEVKAFEAQTVVDLGAAEVDMVMNIGALKSQDVASVREDIEQVVKACKEALVKVIIETGYLNDEEKVQACKLAREAGAAFVKTSTGFGSGGATVADVMLMRKTVGERFGVKAAGGIRTFKDCVAMIDAGANRIGTSSAIQILRECPV
jgi:deoxyribose-phosphate aldolase